MSKRRRFPWLNGGLPSLLAIAGLFLALCAWAFASPVGSSPDEDHHLVSIWCAGGGVPGQCESTGNPTTREVSKGLLYSACFAHKSDVSAACQDQEDVFTSTDLIVTDRGNFFGGYPGGYFTVMRVFATSDVQTSVLVMRILNIALFAGLLLAFVFLGRPRIATAMLATAAVTLVPLGLFTIASINPSSWAFIAMFASFFGTLEFFSHQAWRKWTFGGIALLGVGLAASARYDAMIYAVLAVTAAAFISVTIRISKRTRLFIAGALVAAGVLFVCLRGLAFLQAFAGSAGNAGQQDTSPVSVLFYNIVTLPELFAGFSGENGLGWLDTAMPATAWMVASALLWSVLFSRIREVGKKALMAAGVIAGLLIAVPLLVLQLSNATVGQNVQARYLFPLLIILASVLLAGSDDLGLRLSRTQRVILAAGLSLSQAIAIFFNMSRYISAGRYPTGPDLNAAAELGWWWNAGPSPMLVLLFAVLGFTGFAAFTLVPSERGISATDSDPVGLSPAETASR